MISNANQYIEDLMNIVECMSIRKQETFISIYDSGLFNVRQLIEICKFISYDYDLDLITNHKLDHITMSRIFRVVVNKNNQDCIKNLITYDELLVKRVLDYYDVGKNIISLIDLNDSPWYLEFLLDCLDQGFNILILCDLGFDYSIIWCLCNCIVLRYDVESFLQIYQDSLEHITKLHIKGYFIGSVNKPSKLYKVLGYREDREVNSYLVLAKNERDAKLYCCLNGEFDSLSSGVIELEICKYEDGIIDTN